MKKIKDEDSKNIFIYKRIGTILVYLAIIPAASLSGILRIIITLSVLIISYLFFRKFKCPYCNHIFDPRITPLEYCNECGNKIKNGG